jgi:hypothetical protein
MVHIAASLVTLPPELILDISDHLPVDAIVALQLTHRKLHETLPIPPRLKESTLSKCAHLAIRTYLSPPDRRHSHLRCILCKAVYPISMFKSSSSPACLPVSFVEAAQDTDVVELPQRMCSWHVSRLARIIHTEPGGKNEWTSHMEDMCIHCGAIQGWEKCECRCDTCHTRPVRAYTRYLNNARECRRFLFWLDEADALQLMVRETCWFSGESNASGDWLCENNNVKCWLTF